MVAPQSSVETTESICTAKTVRGRHVFKIAGYSLHKGLGAGNFIRSATFFVGGHGWSIRYYPDGDGRKGSEDCVSIHLERMSKSSEVRALFGFRLTKKTTRLSFLKNNTPRLFNDVRSCCGYTKFINRSILEASPYLRNGRIMIVCDIAVIMGTSVSESELVCEIQEPPSDLQDNLGKLLESKEGADVTFEVNGEVFHAHRIVLAMRSPVFKAELYGPMTEKSTRSITIEDMHPAAFRTLLHFIYTDSLPAMDDFDGDEYNEMVKHLLVAADRYAMERMKKLCETILSKKLDVESVATTLAVADQHHCSKLKDACIQFINSSNRMDDVVASQRYQHLKRACPSVFVDIWEKSAKSC